MNDNRAEKRKAKTGSFNTSERNSNAAVTAKVVWVIGSTFNILDVSPDQDTGLAAAAAKVLLQQQTT